MSNRANSKVQIANSKFLFSPFRFASPLWLALALLVGLLYLAVSAWGFGFVGFPLDDAWIHQTYARNLAQSGQLAFTPGVPSAGSTAPLWTLLLSIGYLLGIPFQIWTYGLGMLLLGLTGATMARLGQRLFPRNRVGLWIGLFCVFEWHLVWAAVSGMETMLFVWLSALLVERYYAGWLDESTGKPVISNFYAIRSTQYVLGLGLLGGLLILTRPEGLGLLGLLGLDMAYRSARQLGKLWRTWLWLALGAGLLLAPYILFHLWLTGQPLPNTFYAKQAEYREILETYPLWWRLFGNFGRPVESVQGVFRVIFTGSQILLLPGLGVAAWLTIRERRTVLLPIWLWWLSYLILYAVSLPVTYQHGRYQIPVLVWVILLGVWGTSRLFGVTSRRGLLLRASRSALGVSIIVLALAFDVLGAQAYGRDVRFIESEMVATARWLNDHTQPDALIAAHDIGAIGYFTQRPLIDLAGLVTPEVIPIIRDEAALFDFLAARRADYLVTFPSWYPQLTRHWSVWPRYSTNAPWSAQLGSENMTVYQLVWVRP